MAFLCPPMFGANKKKRDRAPCQQQLDEKYLLPTEDTRSASPTTGMHHVFASALSLDDDDYDVNVFLLVKRHFTASHASELTVKRNDIVMFLHKDKGWLFVRQKDGYEGYVPRGSCRLYDPLVKQVPTDNNENWVAEVYHDRATTTPQTRDDVTLLIAAEDDDAARASSLNHGYSHSAITRAASPYDGGDIVPYTEVAEFEHCCYCSGCCQGNGSENTKRCQDNIRCHGNVVQNNNMCTECSHKADHPSSRSDRSPSQSDYSSDDCRSSHSSSSYIAMVIREYLPERDGDVALRRGDHVTVLQDRGDSWLWVRTANGEEGFAPIAATSTQETLQRNSGRRRHHRKLTSESSDTAAVSSSSSGSSQSLNLYGSTKLGVVRDYTATKYDELTVKARDLVYANPKDQPVAGLTWAYLPRLKMSGFIPTQNLHILKRTSL